MNAGIPKEWKYFSEFLKKEYAHGISFKPILNFLCRSAWLVDFNTLRTVSEEGAVRDVKYNNASRLSYLFKDIMLSLKPGDNVIDHAQEFIDWYFRRYYVDPTSIRRLLELEQQEFVVFNGMVIAFVNGIYKVTRPTKPLQDTVNLLNGIYFFLREEDRTKADLLFHLEEVNFYRKDAELVQEMRTYLYYGSASEFQDVSDNFWSQLVARVDTPMLLTVPKSTKACDGFTVDILLVQKYSHKTINKALKQGMKVVVAKVLERTYTHPYIKKHPHLKPFLYVSKIEYTSPYILMATVRIKGNTDYGKYT